VQTLSRQLQQPIFKPLGLHDTQLPTTSRLPDLHDDGENQRAVGGWVDRFNCPRPVSGYSRALRSAYSLLHVHSRERDLAKAHALGDDLVDLARERKPARSVAELLLMLAVYVLSIAPAVRLAWFVWTRLVMIHEHVAATRRNAAGFTLAYVVQPRDEVAHETDEPSRSRR
jgi:hypothetical protein